jgi:hypothetical protein
MRFSPIHRQGEELRVIAAMREEENGAAIRHPFSGVLAALVGGGRPGELARCVLLYVDQPDMRFCAV